MTVFAKNPAMHSISTRVKPMITRIRTGKKAMLKTCSPSPPCTFPHLIAIFSLFTSISWTNSSVRLLPLKSLSDKQSRSRGTPCYNVAKEKMSTSRHLYMLSVFITTPWELSCHSFHSVTGSHNTDTCTQYSAGAHRVKIQLYSRMRYKCAL